MLSLQRWLPSLLPLIQRVKEAKKCMPHNMAFRTKGTLTLRAQFLLYGVIYAALHPSVFHCCAKNTLVVQETEPSETATRDKTTLCYS